MRAVPFAGQAYTDKSLPANAQEAVNLYPMRSPTADNPQRVVMYPTPGYALFADTTDMGVADTGAVRAAYEINDVLFVVSGSKLLEITIDGTATDRGTLNTSTGRCSVTCNTVELAISDGTDGYTYNLSTNAFAVNSGGSWPAQGVTNLTFIDGYVLGAPNGTNDVIQSDLLDAGTYDALATVTTTSFPDNVRAVYSDQLQLYVFGPKLCEVRFNAAATPFAFEKQQGVLIGAGCVAWPTLADVGGVLCWLASDAAGKAFVAALSGYTPRMLSTPPMNEAMERYQTVNDAFAHAYREGDNHFYCLTFPSADVTWVIEPKTGWVHQRSVNGGRDLPDHYVLYRGRHLVGDSTGKLYWMSQDYSTDADGNGLRRVRACQHLAADGATMFVDELTVDVESGVGLLPVQQGDEPLATLEVSRDGGRTWTSVGTQPMGAIGEYKTRLTWRRLGRFRTRATFRLTVSDPVRTYILGAWAQIRAGLK